MAKDPLQRFVDAQDDWIDIARHELRKGEKESHWMWFIFPQIAGLGFSPTAQIYAIASRAEAEAYLRHPVLGARLHELTQIVTGIEGRSAVQIFGKVDALKFRSSMTLFANATADNADFTRALDKFYGGEPDARTLELLESSPL
jgi:uncharacterized protein (DUF1810 family)